MTVAMPSPVIHIYVPMRVCILARRPSYVTTATERSATTLHCVHTSGSTPARSHSCVTIARKRSTTAVICTDIRVHTPDSSRSFVMAVTKHSADAVICAYMKLSTAPLVSNDPGADVSAYTVSATASRISQSVMLFVPI
jgi:hypothetical protein